MHPAFKTFGGLNLPTIPHSALCSTDARTRHCTAPSPSCAWALILWLTSYGVIYLPQEDSFPRACLLSTHYFLTSPYGALHSSQFLEQSGCTCTFDTEMQTALCQCWLLTRLPPLEPQALLMPRHCWTCSPAPQHRSLRLLRDGRGLGVLVFICTGRICSPQFTHLSICK